MKTTIRIVVTLIVGIALGGCTAVLTETPIGERPADLSSYDLEGVWIVGDDPREAALTFEVLDSETGLLMVGWVEAHKKDLKLMKHTVQVYEQGDWLVAHLVDEEFGKHPLWFLVKASPGTFKGFVPDPSVFADLVKSGKLEGKKIKDDHILIQGLSSDMIEKLVNNKELEAFYREDDFILRRPVFAASREVE